MKIDKIVFSVSEEFSPFWNMQSYIWKEKLGIEPVCILWGDVRNTDMRDTYGEIIEKKYDYDMIKSFQLTWSKFYHTKTEPDTTWIIGDIDLFPLQRNWFTRDIMNIPDDAYTHLAYGALNGGKVIEDPNSAGVGLTAYYHTAKGRTFTTALGLDECSWEDQIKRVMYDKDQRWGKPPTEQYLKDRREWTERHGFPPQWLVEGDEQEVTYWLADEGYSSYRIKKAIGKKLDDGPGHSPMPDFNQPDAKEYPQWNDPVDFEQGGRVQFVSKLNPDLSEIGNTPKGDEIARRYLADSRGLVDRVDRYNFNKDTKLYDGCMWERSIRQEYVDMHCWRPYNEQEDSMIDVLSSAWGEDVIHTHLDFKQQPFFGSIK